MPACIGPRLVGTPQMEAARDWALAKYKSWNIHAEAQNWGVWRGWERGVPHVDMIIPPFTDPRSYPASLVSIHGEQDGDRWADDFTRPYRFSCLCGLDAIG